MDKLVLATVGKKSKCYGVTTNEFSAIAPNIPMELLASYLRKHGVDVTVLYDANEEEIMKFSPDVLGVIASGANPSSSTMVMDGVIDFFMDLKSDIKTFVCGGHPTALPHRTLIETGADYVVIGEGYETILNLCEGKEEGGLAFYRDGKYVEQKAPPLIDVSELERVSYDPYDFKAHNWHCFGDMDNRTPYGIVWTSLGCPYPCEFCSINNIFGGSSYRLRDIDGVVSEIDWLVSKGVKHIKILDELFVIKNKRIDEFCEKLIERNYDINLWCFSRIDTVTPEILNKLYKAGLRWIAYGIESVDFKTKDITKKRYSLDDLNNTIKWTKDAGINICADIIAGLWTDDYDSLQATYDMCVENNFEWLNVYPCFAYPGTTLYKRLLKEGKIEEPSNWSTYSLYGDTCIPLPTEHLTSAEVLKWRDEKFNEYHSRPEYINMIAKKFGNKTVEHIMRMTSTPLKREIINVS